MRPDCAHRHLNALQEGDPVEEFGPLCEVQSDKAAVEITSRYTGTIARLHHQPGDMVQVGGGAPPHPPCSSVHADAHSGLPAAGVSCNTTLAASLLSGSADARRCQAAQLACVAVYSLARLSCPVCVGGFRVYAQCLLDALLQKPLAAQCAVLHAGGCNAGRYSYI